MIKQKLTHLRIKFSVKRFFVYIVLKNSFDLFMNFLKQYVNNFYYYLGVFSGFIILIFYIYNAFIRERLPKIIPFILTEPRFYTIFFICLIYIWAIYRSMYPKPIHPKLLKILQFISKPFQMFDILIKTNKYTENAYYKYFKIFISKISLKTRGDHIFFLYYIQIFPRMILLTIFLFDIFYVHKIEIFYYFLILGIGILFYQYFIYSIKLGLEQIIEKLESHYKNISLITIFEDKQYTDEKPHPRAIYHNKTVTVKEYLYIKGTYYMEEDHDFNYRYLGSPNLHDNLLIEYKKKFDKYDPEYIYLTQEERTFTYEEIDETNALFDEFEPTARKVCAFLYYHNKQIEDHDWISIIKFIILQIFFVCWCFLFISGLPYIVKVFPITRYLIDFFIDNLSEIFLDIFLTITLDYKYIWIIIFIIIIRYFENKKNNKHD